jgi:CRISPR-associated protein Csb1
LKEAHHDAAGKPWFKKKDQLLQWTQEEAEAESTAAKDKQQKKSPVYRSVGLEWTADEKQAARDKDGKPVKWGKKGKPSELLLGQIAPSIGKRDEGGGDRLKLSAEALRKLGGGVTMKYALQTTVLSFSALRRLRFPNNGSQSSERDTAARTVLAALGLVAITAQRERDYFLRSRCELRAVDSPQFELVVQGRKTGEEDRFTLTFDEAKSLLQQALEATNAPQWKADNEMPSLKPKANLAELIRLSFERGGADEEVESSEPASDANEQ